MLQLERTVRNKGISCTARAGGEALNRGSRPAPLRFSTNHAAWSERKILSAGSHEAGVPSSGSRQIIPIEPRIVAGTYLIYPETLSDLPAVRAFVDLTERKQPGSPSLLPAAQGARADRPAASVA